MKLIVSLLLGILLSSPAYATLTATYTPVTKTGGSSPVLQNGSIIDTGTASGSGNVGIGSVTPGTQLDVNGTVRIKGNQILNTTSSYTSGVGISNLTVGEGNIGIGTSFAVSVVNPSTNFERFSLGSISFSDTSPAFKIIGKDNTEQPEVALCQNSNRNYCGYFQLLPTSSDFTFTSRKNNSDSVIWTVQNSSGNFGIGITSPVAAFEVNLNSQIDGTLLVKNVLSNNNGITTQASVTAGTNNDGNGLVLGTTNTYKFNRDPVTSSLFIYGVQAGFNNISLAQNSGNVGIGTSTVPGSKLSVYGGEGIGTGYISNAAPTNGLIVQGNVGFGSTAPGQALDVQGTVRINGIRAFNTNQIKASVKTSANQACNTTCSAGGCLMGEDTSVLGSFVDCADATADRCICLDGTGG